MTYETFINRSHSFPPGPDPKRMRSGTSDIALPYGETPYNMIYINMGHNVIDHENRTKKKLSQIFNNKTQNKLIINGHSGLGKRTDSNKPDSMGGKPEY